jgi:hypothetical protein
MPSKLLAGALVVAGAFAQQQPDKRKTVPQGYHIENAGPTGEELPKEAPPAIAPAVIVPAELPTIAVPTARRDDTGDLSAGRIETKGFGGINYVRGRAPRMSMSYGSEIGVGALSFLAFTGDYAHDRIGTGSFIECSPPLCTRTTATLSIQTAMGGVRLSVPRLSRVTPYGSFALGLAHLSANGTASSILGNAAVSDSANRLAMSTGGGLNVKISRGVGIDWSMRGVKAMDVGWYFRSAAGIYWRFR